MDRPHTAGPRIDDGSTSGLSGPVTTKLAEQWKAEWRAFADRDLVGVSYVHLWVDGVHVNVRLAEHRLCLLVMIGVRADGRIPADPPHRWTSSPKKVIESSDQPVGGWSL